MGGPCREVDAATAFVLSQSRVVSWRSDCLAGIAGGANLTSQLCAEGRLKVAGANVAAKHVQAAMQTGCPLAKV